MRHIRIAGRASKLALVQSNYIRDLLQNLSRGVEISIMKVSTKGDPIFIPAYTDPEDPDGSIVASTMITEPGHYTLDGIGLGWRGYV